MIELLELSERDYKITIINLYSKIIKCCDYKWHCAEFNERTESIKYTNGNAKLVKQYAKLRTH